jgi:hypothetical protein
MHAGTAIRSVALLSLAVVLVGFGAGPGPAAAQPPDYFPLTPGLLWQYESAEGSTWTIQTGGVQQVLGIQTRILLETISTPELQIVLNFWTVDAQGRVFLHGAMNLSNPFVAAYQPPIQWLDAPLTVGALWSTTFDYYDSLEGGIPVGSGTVVYTCNDEADLTVPAGVFHAFEVGEILPPPLVLRDGKVFDVRGYCLGESGTPAERDGGRWYSDGTGLVQQDYLGETFQLMSWNGPIATRAATWGRVKSLYR